MGHRVSACVRGGAEGLTHTGTIVPDQDPLRRPTRSRVQRCDIARDFELQKKVLGTGFSGAVRLAVAKGSGQQVAVKQFSKRRLKPHLLQLLQNEVEVYLRLDHPNICRLQHAYETSNDVSLVMELCGCELYTRLCERKVYREQDAADVMLQMLQAVSYLHSHGVVHRDLKLQNWVYGTDDRLKLIDFGFSRLLADADETLEMPCGTLRYTSPEVLNRKYTSKCDIWSLGVICFMLLTGTPPFRGANDYKMAKAIIHDDFPGRHLQDIRWLSLSGDAQSFVISLLEKDATMRPSATMALEHRWIEDAVKLGSEISLDVLMNLKNFARGSHLQKAALTMLAYSLTCRELQDLEETFLAFDKSGRGTITPDKLTELMHEHMQIAQEEVERIFQSMDFSDVEEIHYTPFIAAMLATRVDLHEDKVHETFELFDQQGSGFITADDLLKIFDGFSGKPLALGSMQGRGLTKDEAEQWTREVDYKGNGVIDYDGFRAALMGKRLWHLPSLDEDPDAPTAKVFENDDGQRTRGLTDSFFGNMHTSVHLQPPSKTCATYRSSKTCSTMYSSNMCMSLSFLSSRRSHDTAWLAIDDEDEEERRAQSFQHGCPAPAAQLQFRTASCDVDETYFA